MGANKVDIVFVVDASDSMTPCFQKLRDNLRRFIQPLNQASFEIRYGLVAYNNPGQGVYWFRFIGGDNGVLLDQLYSPQINPDNYFTADADKFLQSLDAVRTQGDEDSPMALDVAADFPFDDICESRRVIAFFSNEKLECGMLREKPLAKFPQVLQKIIQRKIALYAYLPKCNCAEALESLPKAIVGYVDGGPNCWDGVDFGKVLEQMGKSISATSLQIVDEPPYQKAVYGQDKFVRCGVTEAIGDQ